MAAEPKNRAALGDRARRVLTHRAFRALVAVALLGVHLGLLVRMGGRFQLPFDRAPASPPAFQSETAGYRGGAPTGWNRLLVSRWDSQYYIGTALRGYSQCPPGDLRGKALGPLIDRCSFHFYPGYSVLGMPLVAAGMPADYALLAVSLLASFLFLYLWTGPALTERLGLGPTWLALLLFNAYTTGFALVTVQTEPLTLLCALGTFVLFSRRRLVLAALVAGAAGSLRVTGSTIGLAYVVALVGLALRDDSEPLRRRWLRIAWLAPLAGWGQLAIFAYFAARYRDPFLYVNAHAAEFSHSVSLIKAIFPSPRVVSRALSLGPREGLFMVMAALFLGLGLRRTLRAFSPGERWYWVGLLTLSVGVSFLGSAGLAYAGMNRYLLLALPVFFTMAVVLWRKPAALAVWLGFSVWNYWQSDLCTYVGDRGSERHCGIFWVPPP